MTGMLGRVRSGLLFLALGLSSGAFGAADEPLLTVVFSFKSIFKVNRTTGEVKIRPHFAKFFNSVFQWVDKEEGEVEIKSSPQFERVRFVLYTTRNPEVAYHIVANTPIWHPDETQEIYVNASQLFKKIYFSGELDMCSGSYEQEFEVLNFSALPVKRTIYFDENGSTTANSINMLKFREWKEDGDQFLNFAKSKIIQIRSVLAQELTKSLEDLPKPPLSSSRFGHKQLPPSIEQVLKFDVRDLISGVNYGGDIEEFPPKSRGFSLSTGSESPLQELWRRLSPKGSKGHLPLPDGSPIIGPKTVGAKQGSPLRKASKSSFLGLDSEGGG